MPDISLVCLIQDAKKVLDNTRDLSKLLPQSFVAHEDKATLTAGAAEDTAKCADDWPALKQSLQDIAKRIRLAVKLATNADWVAGKPSNVVSTHLCEAIPQLEDAIKECEAYKDKGGR